MAAPLPFLGSKISLISNAGIRYEGILFDINAKESTVGLQNVRLYGTEGRKQNKEIPPSDEVYDYIVFRGHDIQDLSVSEASRPNDPAIVSMTPMSSSNVGGGGMGGTDMHHHHHASATGGLRFNNAPHKNNRNLISHQLSSHTNPGMNYVTCPSILMDGASGLSGQMRHPLNANKYTQTSGRDYMPASYGSRMNPTRFGYHPRPCSNNPMQHQQPYDRRNMPGVVIGELPAQPNTALKSQVENAFDFDAANLKFEKDKEDSKENESTSNAAGGTTQEPDGGSSTRAQAVYDKNSSFFDNISCRSLDRLAGQDNRLDRSKQRQLDVETFGTVAPAINAGGNPGHMRRGYMRGFRRGGLYSYGGINRHNPRMSNVQQSALLASTHHSSAFIDPNRSSYPQTNSSAALLSTNYPSPVYARY